jgi:cell division protein FtsB
LKHQIPVLLICVCLIGYFGYHAIQGKHGLEARARLVERSHALDREVAELRAVLARLEHETSLLSEVNPDPDYIDERARELLGFARPDERILMRRSGPR